MSKICVVGAGYVGLVSAACLAKLGHDLTCLEIDADKAASVTHNHLPIREPRLEPLWEEYQRQQRLRITTDPALAVPGSDFILLCVGTPGGQNGAVNLRYVISAAHSIIEHLGPSDRPIVAIRSTVPVGTAELVAAIFANRRPGSFPPVISNPEFLREGQAVSDFLQPARIVIGTADQAAADSLAGLYRPLNRPIVFCGCRTAELIKYAANAFLATKISFINEIAALCESYHVDVTQVAAAVGMDPRIGRAYLDAGLGWGGSCLPKDLAALIRMAAGQGTPHRLLTATLKVNRNQPRLLINKLRRLLGPLGERTIAVWGLTFKPDCDDLRDSPAIHLVRLLQRQGCRVQAYDPVAATAAGALLPDVTLCSDAYSAARASDAIVLATAWREFQGLDLERLRRLVRKPVMVDARNCLSMEEVIKAGFTYVGVGRSLVAPRGEIPASLDGQVALSSARGRPAAVQLAASATENSLEMELP